MGSGVVCCCLVVLREGLEGGGGWGSMVVEFGVNKRGWVCGWYCIRSCSLMERVREFSGWWVVVCFRCWVGVVWCGVCFLVVGE